MQEIRGLRHQVEALREEVRYLRNCADEQMNRPA